MTAAQAGDRAAYDALLRDCARLAEVMVRRQGIPPDQVGDVVQDVLLAIHRARHTYDPGRPFDAWLSAIAKRRAIDALRRRGRQGTREVHAPVAYESHADPGHGPLGATEQAERAKRLRESVSDLPERQREAVEQLVLQDRSLPEAAAATGRTTGALKVSLHRALRALQVTMRGEE